MAELNSSKEISIDTVLAGIEVRCSAGVQYIDRNIPSVTPYDKSLMVKIETLIKKFK